MSQTRRRRRSVPRQHCHHCGSTHLTQTAWQELVPAVTSIDANLAYDGAKSIPRALTYCGSCGEWLASSAEEQQVEELIAGIRLVVSSPALAGAQIESDDRPDIRLHVGDQTYGLEVTAIVRDGDEALKRAKWRRAVHRTARILRRTRGRPPAWISLRWNPDPPFTAVDAAAALLVDEVDAHLVTVPLVIHAYANVDPAQLSPAAEPYIHGFHVVRTRDDDKWTAGYTLLPPVPPAELQETIDTKADVLGGYTAHPDGLWLLVYAEAGVDAALDLELTAEAEAAEYVTEFDRVLFLNSMNKVSDLRVRRPPP